MLNKLFRPKLIVGTLPVTLANGTTADATQVMSDLNYIVNQINANAAPINNPTFTGTLTAAALTATGLTTPTGGVKGISTNTDAAAGNVDEWIESDTTGGAGVGLSTGVAKTVTSIVLTAGDWDIYGLGSFSGAAGTTVAYAGISISTANNTFGAVGNSTLIPFMSAAIFAVAAPYFPTPPMRKSLAAGATMYLVAQAGFGVNTCNCAGRITARRRQPGA